MCKVFINCVCKNTYITRTKTNCKELAILEKVFILRIRHLKINDEMFKLKLHFQLLKVDKATRGDIHISFYLFHNKN